MRNLYYPGLALNLLLIFVLTPAFSAGYKKWYELYFTDPEREQGKLLYGNPEHAFIRTVKNAMASINGAFYEISSPAVIDELISAKKRGVDVKIVMEKDNFSGFQIERLMNAGIPVVPDDRNGFMHNKFAVIDEEKVWTGSFNITENASKKNNNNAILIHSRELSSIYLEEFNEMYKQRIFGNRKEYSPFAKLRKRYYVKIDDTDINVYFSPEDDVERIIIKRILKARDSIHFMAFSFTSDKIGEAMIKKFKDGVKVAGIFEKKGTGSRYSEYVKMKIEGLPVRLDRNRHTMHHKVIIIDKKLVITGSYNFSENANKKNDENVIMINSGEIAAEYLKEFNRLY